MSSITSLMSIDTEETDAADCLLTVYLAMRFQLLKQHSVELRGDKWMIYWKGGGGKKSWPNFKVLSQHLSGGTEEMHKEPQSG
jgi:hypothetical protein